MSTASPEPVITPQKGQRNEMRMIARAAEVLRCLADSAHPRSLGQISMATGLPRSTIQRLVGALEAEGFVATQAGQPGVRLGKELVRLGSAVHSNLRGVLRPHLQALHTKTQDTVDLTLVMDGQPIVVDQISSTSALRVVSFIGRPLPLHATASGKAHVMAMTLEEAKAMVPAKLQAHTKTTNTSVSSLLKLAGKLEHVAFGIDKEEFDEGVCAIALPIYTANCDNYAVAISMPTKRFNGRLPLLRDALLAAKQGMEAALGVN